jgi:hypothetical protein
MGGEEKNCKRGIAYEEIYRDLILNLHCLETGISLTNP